METADWVGWAAVAVLFATMASQAWKEWRDRVKHGVSRWFFAGQVTASVLFIAYSAIVGNAIFVVGNTLVLLAAIAGGAILAYNRSQR
jgi:uncharacterized protein with PQ loop repeat